MSRGGGSERVQNHFDRRRSVGETPRRFFVRDEHMQLLRRYQFQHGYPNQHTAIQALLEELRADQNTAKNEPLVPRTPNHPLKDGT